MLRIWLMAGFLPPALVTNLTGCSSKSPPPGNPKQIIQAFADLANSGP
jgi:hypothetical protein